MKYVFYTPYLFLNTSAVGRLSGADNSGARQALFAVELMRTERREEQREERRGGRRPRKNQVDGEDEHEEGDEQEEVVMAK